MASTPEGSRMVTLLDTIDLQSAGENVVSNVPIALAIL
jgi:hypothetical protein